MANDSVRSGTPSDSQSPALTVFYGFLFAACLIGFGWSFISMLPASLQSIQQGTAPYMVESGQDGLVIVGQPPSAWKDDEVGIEIGDRILAIGGEPVLPPLSEDDLISLLTAPVTEEVTWTVQTGSDPLRKVRLRYPHSHTSERLRQWGVPKPYQLPVLMFVGSRGLRTLLVTIAAFILFFRRKKSLADTALACAVVAFGFGRGLGMMRGVYPDDLQPWLALSYFVTFAAGGYGVLTFPDGRFAAGWIKVLAALWIATAVLILGPSFAPLLGLGDLVGDNVLSKLDQRKIQLIFWASAFVAIFYRYVKHASALERMGMRWLIWAFAIAVPAAAITQLQLVPNPIGNEFFMWVAFPLGMTLVPLALALISVNYRLWDLPDLSRDVGLWFIAGCVFLMMCVVIDGPVRAALLLGIPTLSHENFVNWAISNGVTAMLAGGALFAFRRRLILLIDHILFPQRILSTEALLFGQDAAKDCETTEDLAWCVVATIRYGWGDAGVDFWRVDDNARWHLLTGSHQGACPIGADLLPAFEAGQVLGLTNPNTLDGNPPVQLIPLVENRKLCGAIMIEPGPGHFGFTSDELKRVEEFALSVTYHLTEIMQTEALNRTRTFVSGTSIDHGASLGKA